MNKEEVAKTLNEKVRKISDDFAVFDNTSPNDPGLELLCYMSTDTYELVARFDGYCEHSFDIERSFAKAISFYETGVSGDNIGIYKIEKAINVFYNEFLKNCEEKKYRLKVNPELFDDILVSYDPNNHDFYFNDGTDYYEYKTKFTYEDIEDMPDEIKKAIGCGFLIKEKVDE